jgi:hypothetical protein
MSDNPRPFADRDDPGNRIRPKVRCVGCKKLGCTTAWGPWCYDCNIERMDRIDKAFEEVLKGYQT